MIYNPLFIIQKSHQMRERRLINGVTLAHDESQIFPENNREISSVHKLRYISFGICNILLIIGIVFTVTDIIAIKSKEFEGVSIIQH